MINQRIGAFIATLRKEQNLTQEQFAEKLGVSNRSVSRWENGVTLPDLTLMQCICEITGITLSELLIGARQVLPDEGKDSALLVLALWEREKVAKTKTLNLWFALGLAALLTVILSAEILNGVEILLLVGFGVFFHGLGFYHNNRDPRLTDREKAVLLESKDGTAMCNPVELLAYVRKQQSVAVPQYGTAFRTICENLAEHERISFAMVANEYIIDTAPGIWHAGIAVTQDRVLLCGEFPAGRFMTRTVMDSYDRKEIVSVQYTNRSICMKTARKTVTIKGKDLGHLGEDFKNAIRKGE